MTIHLLLVDDDPPSRKAIRRLLEASGLDLAISEAESGLAAISILREKRFDCVLLDQHLTDMNGAAVFLEMAKDHQSAAATVFLADTQNEALVLRVLEAGVAECLDKRGLTADALSRGIRHALARQQYMSHLRALGHHDGLTRLPNRTLFEMELASAIAQSKRTGKLLALALLDLDNFKTINDRYGHLFGDQLLVGVAARLSAAVRESDFVARIGGDEFAVLAMNMREPEGAVEIANKLLDAFRREFEIEREPITATASIGIAVYPMDGQEPALLFKNADLALYKAKDDGRGVFRFFEGKLASPVRAVPGRAGSG